MIEGSLPLYHQLQRTAGQRGSEDAFVCQGERLNWLELKQRAGRTAKALMAHGVKAGDHVGVMLGNGALWIEVFYACASIGAVTVPINTRFKTDELAYCLKHADVKLLILADRFLGIDFIDLLRQVEPALDASLPGQALPCLERVIVAGTDVPAACEAFDDFILAGATLADSELENRAGLVSLDSLLLMQFTSGTTSFPKGVMLTHGNMLTNARAVAQRIGMRPEDRYFSIRPYFHVAGTTLSILVSLVTGCCLLTLPKFDVEENLAVLENERCTMISGNDTIFLMLMGHPRFDRSKLHLRGGWAAAGVEVMQKIRDDMGVPFMCNAYGQSEASPNVTMTSWEDPFELRAAGWGLPLEGVQIRVTDAQTHQPLPPGSQGEIEVKGWNVMRGYYKMPEQTEKALTPDGWLRTGDLGEISAVGRLRMVGRLKDVYRVGGENVAPAEVEETLLSNPAVQLAQVVGVPDARLGEVTAAFVVLKEGHRAEEDELVAWCKGRCANFKVPRYLRIVDSFEHIGMTGSSKVQKNKLKDHAIQIFGLADQMNTGAHR